MSTYSLSIETDAGTYRHGFHLGSEEAMARTMAEEICLKRKPKLGTVIKTVALIRDDFHDTVAYFDGTSWSDADTEPQLYAVVSHPRSGSFTVECYYRISKVSTPSMLAVTLPAKSYEHAKAIADAINGN